MEVAEENPARKKRNKFSETFENIEGLLWRSTVNSQDLSMASPECLTELKPLLSEDIFAGQADTQQSIVRWIVGVSSIYTLTTS